MTSLAAVNALDSLCPAATYLDLRRLAPSLVIADLGPEPDDQVIAGRLFAAMRQLDQEPGVELLIARTVSTAGLGAAVNDRLLRAADRVISAPAG